MCDGKGGVVIGASGATSGGGSGDTSGAGGSPGTSSGDETSVMGCLKKVSESTGIHSLLSYSLLLACFRHSLIHSLLIAFTVTGTYD